MKELKKTYRNKIRSIMQSIEKMVTPDPAKPRLSENPAYRLAPVRVMAGRQYKGSIHNRM
jgi:hypothetical protein